MIDKIKHIESVAYPEFMQQMQGIKSKKELADYCECKVSQLFCLHGENWYLLAANKQKFVEIVDFASINGITREQFLIILNGCLSAFRGKKITCSCRETTSYPLIKRLQQDGVIKIKRHFSWSWEGEIMNEVTFIISIP